MRIELMNPENLVPYERNNRVHSDLQIDRIAESIKTFGFNQPIVVDEKNVLLVGHARLFAAQKLNLKSVPVVKLTNLTKEQKVAYRILDNKIQNDSTWNFENLEHELELLSSSDFDVSFCGLSDLQELIENNAATLKHVDETIASGVEKCVCAACGHEHSKQP